MHCNLVIRQKLLAINTKIFFTLRICKLVKFTKNVTKLEYLI